MTNETKVGLLAVITIVMSVLGYNFLKGINLVNAPKIIYADYDNVASLPVSAPVIINGLQVGVVKDMYFKEDLQTIRVAMNIEKDFLIPRDAEAVITSTSIMGGSAIILKYSGVCSGNDCVQNEEVIRGRVASAIEAFLGEPEELDPYFKNLKANVGPITDSIKASLTDPNSDDAISKSIRDIAVVLENLKTATANLNQMVIANSQQLNGTLKNAQALTDNLNENEAKINGILANADSLTGNLAELRLEKTLNQATQAMQGLESTMASADKAVGQLNQLLEKINRGEGAIGKLLNDEQVVDDFSTLAVRLDSFLTDFQERPYRYVPLMSKRKVEKYDRQDN
ncbi:MAG: MlaD family protein [Bacteroidota bacterium]